MSEYDNRGQAALWRSKSENPKAPIAKGNVTAHRDIKEGEELELSFWKNDSDNPNAPFLKGKLGDKYEKGEPGAQIDPDDDIPFNREVA